MRNLRTNEQGAVYVEFLLVFFPVFIIFLGLIQASLLFTANLMVRHAATVAARAAMVVVDDDPSKYSDESRGDLSGDDSSSSSGGDNLLGGLISLVESNGDSNSTSTTSTSSGDSGSGDLGGKRLSAIRSAAQMALLGLSPPINNVISPNAITAVNTALGDGANAGTRFAGAALYNQFAVAVTFPQAYADDDNYVTSFSPNQTMHVRVSYLYQCPIPIANRLVCDSMLSFISGVPLDSIASIQSEISSGTLNAQRIQDAIDEINARRDRVARGKKGVSELDESAMPSLRYYALTGGRYALLRGEAAMPNHSAPYAYPEDE